MGCTDGLMREEVPSPVVLGDISIAAAFEYAGVVRALILRLKRHRSVSVADLLARLALSRLGLEDWNGVVTWAPTTASHLHVRGHDQARVLASAVGRRVGTRPRHLLRRVGDASQTGASRRDRLQGPTFVGRPTFMSARQFTLPILVIDDVVTTGATLRGACQSLSKVSAADVRCVAIAATPGPMGAR